MEEETKLETTGGAEESLDAGGENKEPSQTREERYRAMVGGECKDLFAADVQRIIDRRFKEMRELQEALAAQRPVLDRLMARYGVENGDLAALNTALDEEEERRAQEERELEELLRQTALQAARERERALIQDILARGGRPAENGADAQNGIAARRDPARMTREERAEIARRARYDKTITFR